MTKVLANDSSGNNNHDIQGAKWEKYKICLNRSIPDSDSLYAEKAWTITSWIFVNKAEGGYGHIIGKRSGAGTNYAFRTDSGCIGTVTLVEVAGKGLGDKEMSRKMFGCI